MPPQSSVEKSPIRITRTRSPYFSPNSAMAPLWSAAWRSISAGDTTMFACTCSLTSDSTRSTLRILDAGRVREVEAQVVGRHQRAGLGDVGAQHLAQRRVEQMRAGVVQPQALAPARVHRHRHLLVLAEARPAVTFTRWTMS